MSELRAYLGTNRVIERIASQADSSSEKKATLLIGLKEIKSILRQSLSDSDLTYYLDIAMQWVEEHLGKTLLRALRENTHHNTHLVLPYGPVFSKEDIQKVEYGKNILAKKDYTLRMVRDTFEITVNENLVTYKKTKRLKVTYVAGYPEPSHVPRPLINAVISVIEYLHQHNGDLKGLEEAVFPMMSAHIHYKLF